MRSIGNRQVATASAAGGVWPLREQAQWQKEGLWPNMWPSYWRILFTGSNTAFTYIAEIELRESIGGANACSGGTASASSIYSVGYEASKALDLNNATSWVSSGVSLPSWWMYQFQGGGISIQQISITNGTVTHIPTAFELQYSNDSNSWVTVGSWSGQTFGTGETKTYNI